MATATSSGAAEGVVGGGSAIRDALDETVARYVPVMRGTRRIAPLRGMWWRAGELGAHNAQTVSVFGQVLHGEVTAYGERGEFSAEVDQDMVDALPERNPARLADMVEERYRGFTAAREGHDDAEILPRLQDFSLAAAHAVLLLDINAHGAQMAEASGGRWTADQAAMRLGFETIMPFVYDRAGAQGPRVTFALHVGSQPPIVYSVEDGALHLDGAAESVDCHVGVEPITFLLVTLGAVPRWQAIGTGRIRAWGRRPWFAARIPKLFPIIPHGGIG